MCQRTLLDEVAELVVFQGVFDNLKQTGADIGPVAIADGLHQQFTQWTVIERNLAQNIEDLSAKGVALFTEFSEQALINRAFACFGGDKIPKVTHLSLANAVNSPESLLNAIRIPRQIIVHHQVCALKIDAFASRIGGQQNLRVFVLSKKFLRFGAFLATQAAVNQDDGFGSADESTNIRGQIV